MKLFKIDGTSPQVSPNPVNINPNEGTEGMSEVTLFQSNDNGYTWQAVGKYQRNRFGQFLTVE